MRVPGISYVQGRNYSKDSSGKPIVTTKYGIAIHNTANDATAEEEADYATRRTDDVSSHFYVDSNSVVQSLDTGWRAWHAASTVGNSNSISVEITGVNGWTRSQWLSRVAWDRLGQVLAEVIRNHWPDGSFQVRRAPVTEMSNNSRVKAFYGHHDMTRAWGGDHTDPGPDFPWDRLFDAVSAALEDDMTPDEVRALVVQGIHSALDQAATRSTPTGRQMGDDVATLLAPIRTRVQELLDRPTAPVDVAALAEALRPHMEAAAEEAVRRVLGSLDAAALQAVVVPPQQSGT